MRHAQSLIGDDYTLCGLASDIDAVEADEDAPVFARQGERVDCPDCRAVVDYCKGFRRGYRQPPAGADSDGGER